MLTKSAFLLLVSVLVHQACSSEEYRLPTNVRPVHYDLVILTSLHESDNYTFSGTVKIQVVPSEDVNKIVLHSKELKINEEDVSIKDPKNPNDNLTVSNVTFNKQWDFLIIELNQTLKKDQSYDLQIPFQGRLEEGLVGFYRSSYKDQSTGKTEWLAVTQFEATDARRGFPCFDEPSMKATFSLTLGRQDNYVTISNMPQIETKPIQGKEGWSWDKYEKSVPMSTYLVAYMVSKFVYLESPKQDSNITFKIWARPEAENQTEYAAQIGPKILSHFEKYFDAPYPLPKQDMAAIPDFQAGAMENWGLITYRERALLYSPKTSSISSKYMVATVVAHELAHQWFGNLVTMKWWTDLWLNEGFATYVAMIGVDHVHPEWKSIDIEVSSILSSVYKLDSLNSSHPVSVPIGDPSEISQIFDTISYSKGSSIIRMMNAFLGEDTFRHGVSNYLQKFKYRNADQDDLWQSLTEAGHESKTLPSNMTIKEIMDSWTKQTGYPLLTITRNYENNSASITQSRYRSSLEEFKKNPQQLWWVPLSHADSSTILKKDPQPKNWLRSQQSTEISDMPSADKWVLFNLDITGVFRVKYDDRNWELLNAALVKPDCDGIPVLNRYSLITDSFDLAFAEQLSYDIAFRILTYIENETEYIPWKAATEKLSIIGGKFKRTSQYGTFKKYARRVITPIYNKLGGMRTKKIENPHNLADANHQVLISSWACSLEIGSCVENALEFFNEWMKEAHPNLNNNIPSSLRSVVYCTSAKKMGQKATDFLWQRYLQENIAVEKDRYLSSLLCTQEAWVLNKYLELSITEGSGIRSQDAPSVFANVMGSDIGYYVGKDFLYDRLESIVKHYKSSAHTISRYIRVIGERISSPSDTEQFKLWIEKNKQYLKSASLDVKQALEKINLKKEWNDKNFLTVAKILESLTNDDKE